MSQTDDRINTSIWLDKSQVRQLEELADELTEEMGVEVTRSDVIRSAIDDYLPKEEAELKADA